MITLAALPASAVFVPGAVCDGVDLSGPAQSLLQGKHLLVHETVWHPFAFKDASSPHGWRGLDISLLDGASELLGFTYEIHEAERLPGEDTWTETLLRTVEEVDLWASWWMRDEERMNHTVMLAGHIDTSPTLVRPPLSTGTSSSLVESLVTFYQPFSPQLWACLVAMVLLGGCVDYFIERGHGGTLLSSLYEYSGGVLWGGFQEPHTRMSALYQIANAFIILVAVSVYTANLASMLTMSRRPKATFASLDDLITSRTRVCTVGTYPSQVTYEAAYPSVTFADFDQHGAIADALTGYGAGESLLTYLLTYLLTCLLAYLLAYLLARRWRSSTRWPRRHACVTWRSWWRSYRGPRFNVLPTHVRRTPRTSLRWTTTSSSCSASIPSYSTPQRG